jgi:hypothetical protein
VDISFKDDVTAVFFLGVSFMVITGGMMARPRVRKDNDFE